MLLLLLPLLLASCRRSSRPKPSSFSSTPAQAAALRS
jgi:hypothetical protein